MADGSDDNEKVKILNDLQEISLIEIGVVIILTWLTIRVIYLIIPFLAERSPNKLRLYLLSVVPIARLSLMTMAIIWIIPIVFNITFHNFIVIAGAASVAVGFAFKDYVSALVAGIVALFERPYRPGDWVKIDGDYGEVTSVGLRSLHLVTASDDAITVPHSHLWEKNILNSNDGARTLMCVADFYIAPGHDAARLRTALVDVALTSAYLDYEKPVSAMLSETPYGTHYKLKAYPYDLRDQFNFISDMTVRGKEAIAELGARETTFAFPGDGKDAPPLTG